MKKRNEVIKEIQLAFNNVVLGEGVSLHEARLIDDNCENPIEYEKVRLKDQESSWNEIEESKIIKFGDTLPFVNPYGFRFYIPAFMIFALNNPHSDAMVVDSTIYNLTFDDVDDYDSTWLKQQISKLNNKQISACMSFLEYVHEYGEDYDSSNIDYSLRMFWRKLI